MGVGVIAILLAFLVFLRILRNYRRLSSIPGPSLAGWSDLWRIHARNSPHYGRRLSDLHLEYGKAVRLGPNFVSVADPAVIYQLHQNEAYGTVSLHTDLTATAGSHLSGFGNTQQWHTTRDQFGGLSQYEGAIDPSAQELVKAIRRYHTLDLTASLRIFATTFVSDFVLAGALHQGRVNGQTTSSHRYPNPLSMVEYLLFKSPGRTLRRGHGGQLASCTRLPAAPARNNAGILNGVAPAQSQTAAAGVLEKAQNAASGAGSLVSTFVSAFYFLAKNPEAMSRLKDEIDTAFAVGSLSGLPLWREVKRLPYLNAVMKESMRLSSAVSFEEEIVAPRGGATIAGMTICEGTVIGCNSHVLHFDRGVYGNAVHLFQPDRWLTANLQERKSMEQGLLIFNRGARSYPDVQVAWLELKKIVVLLLMKFNMRVLNADEPATDTDTNIAESRPSMIVTFSPRVPGF
ncbi:cytochrome P450 [Aspergillus ellipticus CBS 707.79]|uniref:Cytochrome P450 n=1 Tax=Aspergillus ellipticus CBS 707.79 TaxID=1448320 RepID=A0A319DCB9_9EURO|nr:cytochrome P450 [Aspergillus ellipticus CBS 707.79]